MTSTPTSWGLLKQPYKQELFRGPARPLGLYPSPIPSGRLNRMELAA